MSDIVALIEPDVPFIVTLEQPADINAIVVPDTEPIMFISLGGQGPAGPQGPQGIQGIQGIPGNVGPVGPAGAAGTAATIAVAGTDTGAPGSSASVVNEGSSSAASFRFTIPQGAQGIQGIQGVQGIQGNAGPQGDPGAPGVGVPAGGDPGQVLVKDSITDYDTSWQTFGQVYVQNTDPGLTGAGLWIQTGLSPGGTGFTFWFNDGD